MSVMPRRDWQRIEMKAEDRVAEIYIYDEIGDWGTSAQAFAGALAELDVETINLYINSPGGSAWDGVAIYNALRRHPAKINGFVDGIAASAASLIAMASDHLTMNASSQLMIHDASGVAWGDADTMRSTADLLDKLSDSYADAYAKRAGGSREGWRQVMRDETWYTAEEAVLAGLADDWDGSADLKAVASFDLSRFRFAGRSNAPAPSMPQMAASTIPPAAEPGQQEEESMSEFLAALRDRLGITDAEAKEDAILAALDEALTEQVEPEEGQPKASTPEGVTTIEVDVLEAMRADLVEKTATLAEVQAKADAERRDSIVAKAIKEGKVAPARRDHWLAQLNADEEGAVQVLDSLAPGTIPLNEIGHSDEPEADDADQGETIYAKWTGTEKKES